MTFAPAQPKLRSGVSATESWRQGDSGMAAVCSHCTLPVAPGLIRPGSGVQFCCQGCEAAFTVIHSCGLDRYYHLLDRAQGPRPAAAGSGRAYAEFDDAMFRTLHCRTRHDGLVETELILEGIHCAACVWLVERLPRILTGVSSATLDIRRATVRVTFDPGAVALSRIGRTLRSLGYPPHPVRGHGAADARRIADRRALVHMGVAGACAGNIMLLFFALYAGMFEGMERGHEQLLRWTAMVLNTVCLAWPGMVFGRGAIAALRARAVQLDVPIALGLYLGGAWGIWKTVAGDGDLYFDSISALVFFLLIGRYVQQRQQRSAADAVELLFSITPSVARRVEADGSVTDVPTEALVPGDRVEIRPGDSVPADGHVESGASRLDLSVLTGESRPVTVVAGDPIAAGSVNLVSVLRARVERTGEATRVGKLMRLVEESTQRRAPIVRLADRWGRWLLWVLLGLAAVTLVLWWPLGPAVAIDHAVALLIATCPCGLGLATPLAMSLAIGRAARRGIFVKGGDALQSLAVPSGGSIVLDKTGTITFGRLALARWHGDDEGRVLVAALEAHSAHPAAQALCRDLASSDAPNTVVEQVCQHAGMGIEGRVNGRQVVVGTHRFLATRGVAADPALDRLAADAIRDGLSPVYVGIEGRCRAMAELGDPIRPGAAAVIEGLRGLGWRVSVLSGDHPDVVAAIGGALRIDPSECRGGATPENKLDAIREMAARGTVVMVGDGINDAAALAAATVGIAVRGGAEASLAAADISLAQEGLAPLLEVFAGARSTMRTIHWTIASSLAYNALAASLSVAGLISPLLAAFIMPASSFTVVAICLRGGGFRWTRTAARGANDTGGYAVRAPIGAAREPDREPIAGGSFA
ncbi:MAG: heavy metal translocating P-type ATPase metal-binding domain-containing protein [Phycisphaerae bacterium]|nr:heavy metal translocating P-type ATPase metal-binding domain-containing protein [Phycisphaerae bacterium]